MKKLTLILILSTLTQVACGPKVEFHVNRFCETDTGVVVSTNQGVVYSPEETVNQGQHSYIQVKHDFTYLVLDQSGTLLDHKDCLNK